MSAALDMQPKSGYGGHDGQGRGQTPDDPNGGRFLSGTRWFVIQTHARAETAVARALSDCGARHYLPMHLVDRRDPHTKTVRKVHAPMFWNHLFFALDTNCEPWTPIRYLPGVRQIFMTASQRPIPVPVGFVEQLIAEAPTRLKLPDVRKPAFPVGRLLKVLEGPLEGMAGNCVASNQVHTDIVLMLLGRSVRVTLANADLDVWPETVGVV